jgi:hypothetical protein
LGFYPGISYQVSKRLHLETGFNNMLDIAYQHTKETEMNSTNEAKSNTFNISTSLNNLASFTLGFRFLLTK